MEHLYAISLFYFFLYLYWFAALEKRTGVHYILIHCPLDDYIPLIPGFIYFYYFWFIYIGIGVTVNALFWKREFMRLVGTLFTGMTLFLIINYFFPTMIQLRPSLEGKTGLSYALLREIYTIDTPTNVLPSIHIYNSLAIQFSMNRWKPVQESRFLRIMTYIVTTGICASTLFLRQHSIYDLLAAVLMFVVFHWFFYRSRFMKRTLSHKWFDTPAHPNVAGIEKK